MENRKKLTSMKLFIKDRGERTRDDDRWMHRWIYFFNGSETQRHCRGKAGEKRKHIKAKRDVRKVMIKEDLEKWRQTGELMSQIPRIFRLCTGWSCLTLSPPE